MSVNLGSLDAVIIVLLGAMAAWAFIYGTRQF